MTTGAFRMLDELLAGVYLYRDERLGVVHVGAHRGQEVADYRRAGFRRIVLVEPNPALWPDLDRLGVSEVHTCAAGSPGLVTLYVTEWDERSSTLLPPGEYGVVETIAVERRPLAEMQTGCNVAVLDVQGAELDVIRSADLDRLDVLIVETSDRVRYEGAATREEIANYLTDAGWRRWRVITAGHSPGIADELWRRFPRCA